jgi:hypothetical protein
VSCIESPGVIRPAKSNLPYGSGRRTKKRNKHTQPVEVILNPLHPLLAKPVGLSNAHDSAQQGTVSAMSAVAHHCRQNRSESQHRKESGRNVSQASLLCYEPVLLRDASQRACIKSLQVPYLCSKGGNALGFLDGGHPWLESRGWNPWGCKEVNRFDTPIRGETCIISEHGCIK